MKKNVCKLLSGILCLVMLMGMAGCGTDTPSGNAGTKNDPINIENLTNALLTKVSYDTPLEAIEDVELFFPDLPDGASADLYMGSGYYADELVIITLASAADAEEAKAAADAHLEDKHNQFASYIQEELPKIDDAIVWARDLYVIICITNDVTTAEDILANPNDPAYASGDNNQGDDIPDNTQGSTGDDTPDNNQGSAGDDTPDNNQGSAGDDTPDNNQGSAGDDTPDNNQGSAGDDTPDNNQGSAGDDTPDNNQGSTGDVKIVYYNSGMIRVGNMAYEPVSYYPSAAKKYAEVVNSAAEALGDGIQVYCLMIPTAVDLGLPDAAKAIYSEYVNQSIIINDVNSRLNPNIKRVDTYNKMKAHIDEYLFFRTDYHWNGPGAYYAYEAFCDAKGIAPYTMAQREEIQFDNYLGYLYWECCNQDPVLKATPDTVYAYKPATPGVTMKYTDTYGNTYSYPIIADVSDWSSASKYLCFAAGDQPFAEFTNPNITDGSACIVVKESFGNALMSYVVDHYSTVYEIDYRYWKGDLAAFAKEHGVTDVIFANNMSMLRNTYLIGQMGRIIK